MTLSTSALDIATLHENLQRAASDFQKLAKSDPKNYQTKLKNTYLLYAWEADGIQTAPILWLLARLHGADWSDTNKNAFVGSMEQYRLTLAECGLTKIVQGDPEFEKYRVAHHALCAQFGFEPSKGGGDHSAANREIWVFTGEAQVLYPDEISNGEFRQLSEGSAKKIAVNAYERSPQLRAECIRIHGLGCAACGLNFEERYGQIGRNFIHVHHKRPLGKVKGAHHVNPKTDLIPLCPNCHAMIHKLTDPADIDALVKVVADHVDISTL